MRRLLLIALLVVALSAAPSIARNPNTADGKPCPKAAQLVTIKRLLGCAAPNQTNGRSPTSTSGQ